MEMDGFFLPMLMNIIKERRVWLLALLGLLAFVVGRWALPAGLAMDLVVQGGYWVILAAFALFVRAMWRLIRPGLAGWRPGRAEVGAAVLVLAVGGMWQAHETRGFKILADEVLLLGTSMDMHYTRDTTYPIRATDVQGPFQVLQGVLDKRPFFYPFVVSLVHDVTGYRPENAFYVNVVLGFLLLGLMYRLGWKITGNRWAGVLAVLLCGGLPLLAQQAAGGGFDLLNLVMLTAVTLLACRYAENPDERSEEALCLAAVLLALTRYESVIFVVPVAGLVVWGWGRAGRVILPRTLWLTPVLLLPYVLQNRIFETQTSAWEMTGQGGGVVAQTPFALHYLPNNLGHALAFFFDTSGFQPNSIFFAVVGLVALPFFGIWMTRILRARERQNPVDVAVVAAGLGLFAINALLMTYFWGQFDHPVIRRLSLPLHLCMILAVCIVVARMIPWHRSWQVLCSLAVAAMVIQGLPAMAKRAYEHDYTPGVEMAWRQEFLNRYPRHDYLFIDRDSVFWIAHHIPATPIKQAQQREDGLAYHLRNHSFAAMYVFQHFSVNDQTGKLTVDPADDLGPNFELQPVWEKRIATLLIGRISRITAIHDKNHTVRATPFVEPVPGPALTPAEQEKARTEYLNNWIKQLP